jgi:hypothetical protein
MLPGGEDVAAQSDVPPIDVLVVVVLEDELDAVLSERGGSDTWQEVRERDDPSGTPTKQVRSPATACRRRSRC